MGWKWPDKITPPVVKVAGMCQKISQWKYCPYWKIKQHPTSGRIIGHRCSLFGEDKEGAASLPACNAQYGTTYEGRP